MRIIYYLYLQSATIVLLDTNEKQIKLAPKEKRLIYKSKLIKKRFVNWNVLGNVLEKISGFFFNDGTVTTYFDIAYNITQENKILVLMIIFSNLLHAQKKIIDCWFF